MITGASSGVGRAAAEAFAKQGANLVLAARGEKAIAGVAEVCRGLNVTAIGVLADMSSADDVERLAEEALKINGRIDVWINNAGVMASGKFEEIPMEIHSR